MRYFDYLLRRPGESISARSLYETVKGQTFTQESGIKLTDETAIKQQKARVEKIEQQLKTRGKLSPEKRKVLKAERDTIVRHLSTTLNRRGVPREERDSNETIRVNVITATVYAKNKIHGQLRDLAEHLDKCMKIRQTCIYQPDLPIKWSF